MMGFASKLYFLLQFRPVIAHVRCHLLSIDNHNLSCQLQVSDLLEHCHGVKQLVLEGYFHSESTPCAQPYECTFPNVQDLYFTTSRFLCGDSILGLVRAAKACRKVLLMSSITLHCAAIHSFNVSLHMPSIDGVA
jgi:hypothetical protein